MMSPLRKKVVTVARITLAVSLALSLLWLGDYTYQFATVREHAFKGSDALEAGDYESAIQHLRAVDHFSPNVPQTRHRLGLAYIKSAEEKVNAYPPEARRNARKKMAAITASLQGEANNGAGEAKSLIPRPAAPNESDKTKP